MESTAQNSTELYILRKGRQCGPLSVDDLNAMLEAETVNGVDLFWYEGCGGWAPLSQFPGFSAGTPDSTPDLPAREEPATSGPHTGPVSGLHPPPSATGPTLPEIAETLRQEPAPAEQADPAPVRNRTVQIGIALVVVAFVMDVIGAKTPSALIIASGLICGIAGASMLMNVGLRGESPLARWGSGFVLGIILLMLSTAFGEFVLPGLREHVWLSSLVSAAVLLAWRCGVLRRACDAIKIKVAASGWTSTTLTRIVDDLFLLCAILMGLGIAIRQDWADILITLFVAGSWVFLWSCDRGYCRPSKESSFSRGMGLSLVIWIPIMIAISIWKLTEHALPNVEGTGSMGGDLILGSMAVGQGLFVIFWAFMTVVFAVIIAWSVAYAAYKGRWWFAGAYGLYLFLHSLH